VFSQRGVYYQFQMGLSRGFWGNLQNWLKEEVKGGGVIGRWSGFRHTTQSLGHRIPIKN